jgi:putative membrane protein
MNWLINLSSMLIANLPSLNAVLNSISACFILTGFVFVKKGNVTKHRACMIGALISSTLFLISYLIYHAYHGSTPFLNEGWIRPLYFTILISHTILACTVVPLVGVTFWRAIKGDIERHRAIARWTFPIWLYVSITGVIVYAMLYHL